MGWSLCKSRRTDLNAGLPTSLTLHVALLAYGLLTLSAPRGLEAADVEALPVEIIPMTEMTQLVEGDKKAPMAEKPAPKPTDRPEIVPDAKTVGEAKVDSEAPPAPTERPQPVETSAAPPPSPKPEPVPTPEPEPVPAVQPETRPEPAPATEVTPEPQPRQEVKPDPVPETKVADSPQAEPVPLPDAAPSPQARPKPPEAQTAKTPERKVAEKPTPEKKAAAQPSEEKTFSEDEVAMLLNKAKPSGGGAKRSTEQASLGGKKTTGATLTAGEMDALRNQLSGCWTIPAGSEGVENLRVSVSFTLDAAGKLQGQPTVATGSGNRIFDESAVRAIRKCDMQGLHLPNNKPEVWASGVTVNFDPSEMF